MHNISQHHSSLYPPVKLIRSTLVAMAYEVPVAAYPVTGPIDVIRNNITGCLNHNFKQAALDAMKIDPNQCPAQASEYTWGKATEMFQSNLVVASNS